MSKKIKRAIQAIEKFIKLDFERDQFSEKAHPQVEPRLDMGNKSASKHGEQSVGDDTLRVFEEEAKAFVREQLQEGDRYSTKRAGDNSPAAPFDELGRPAGLPLGHLGIIDLSNQTVPHQFYQSEDGRVELSAQEYREYLKTILLSFVQVTLEMPNFDLAPDAWKHIQAWYAQWSVMICQECQMKASDIIVANTELRLTIDLMESMGAISPAAASRAHLAVGAVSEGRTRKMRNEHGDRAMEVVITSPDSHLLRQLH